MSRTRNATIQAIFTGVQFVIGIVTGVLLTPMIIAQIGGLTYGLWLTATETLFYFTATDLGVFSTIPWILAKAHGEEDTARTRRILSNAMVIGITSSFLTLAAGLLIWVPDAAWFGISAKQTREIAVPISVLAIATALACPMQVFNAVLTGRQDFFFGGVINLVKSLAAAALTVTLVMTGHGLLGLAIAGIPAAVIGFLTIIRVRLRHSELITEWPQPSRREVAWLLKESIPGWMGSLSHRLVTASTGIILTVLSRPESVAVYYCTAKAHIILQPILWIIPDSGLIGLAQLSGTTDRQIVQRVVRQIILLNIYLTGLGACGIWALNPLFVRAWVGEHLYGGHELNFALTFAFIISGILHGLVTSLAVSGCSRPRLGFVMLLYGGLSVCLSALLAPKWGATGCAWASVLAGLPTCLPYGLHALRQLHGLTIRELLIDTITPWALRSAAPLIAAVYVGSNNGWHTYATITATFVCCLTYLACHRGTLGQLPLPIGVRSILTRVRLVPPQSLSPIPSPEIAA